MRRISVRAIVLHDNKLLCVRQNKYRQGQHNVNNYWNLPGGGLEDGESLTDCLQREMVEETGVAPTVGNLMYIQQFTYEAVEFLEFFFHVSNAADYLDIDLAKTSHGQQEVAEIDFIDPTSRPVLPKFLATEPLAGQANAPTRIFTYQ